MKLGNYVRFKTLSNQIKIGRILEIDDNIYIMKKEVTSDNYIIKSSPNIIDLIEVGDYVNGMYVEDVKETFVNVSTGSNYFQSPTIYEKDIKSIVTKEQFESMEYKVGE